MRKKEILRLVAGFRRFRERYFLESHIYERLASTAGQSPKTLIIGCSDSRVDPAIITSASPGELFVVRNVANIVPPFEEATIGLHGVSSAIEFAVVNLKVENVVILGHRQCGGIRALMLGDQKTVSFISRWMSIVQPAKDRVLAKAAPNTDEETLCRHCEMEAIVTSLQNLRTFPFVQQAIKERDMNLLGVYFDLEQGQLFDFDDESGTFKQIEI